MLTMSESTVKEESQLNHNHSELNNVEVVDVEDVNNIEPTNEEVNNVRTNTNTNGNSDLQEELIDRDIDKSKVQRKFVQGIKEDDFCKLCSKHVYQMEKINAVKSVFHKTCFRCKECKKQLSADNYFSHEGEVYCTPHFKHLFQPKAKFDSEDQAPIKCDQVVYSYDIYGEQGRQRKYELIVRENTPQELPPDVIRYNSKVDDDFDSLQLDLSNIRNRFELGKNSEPNHNCLSISDKSSLNRSESVHKIMQKYESAVSGDRQSASSSDDEGENEKPNESLESEKAVLSGVASTLKSQWEQGIHGKINSNKEDQETTKEELANLRQKMCLGRSESMRQVYERVCKESKVENKADNPVVIFDSTVKTESIKEKFEKGNVDNETEEEKIERLKKEREEELIMFAESDTAAKEARNKFKQIDASASKGVVSPTNNVSPHHNYSNGHTTATKYPQSSNNGEVIKCGDPIEKDDINIDPNQLQERFAYFENLKEVQKEPKRFQITPPRELKSVLENDPDSNRDPNVIRSCDIIEDIPKVDTTKKMLDKFKELENRKENELSAVKPPKHRTISKPENGDGVEQDKARTLKAKFENWSVDRENKRNAGYDDEEDYIPHIDTTKNLRAKFEAIKDESDKQQADKPKPRVNRFVHEFGAIAASDLCSVCGTRLYPMERMEFSGIKLHKNCFRCVHCSSSLRLDNYTTTAGKMYCIPHFKQLFMAKGNYDEGFGLEQHKDKWAHKTNNNNLYNNNNNIQISSRNSSTSSDENDNENDAQYTAHEYSEPLDNDY